MYIVCDIGGTNTRIAVSADGKTFGEPKFISTPLDYHEGVAQLVEISRELTSGGKITAVCCGVAGPLDQNRSMLVNSPNLSDWINKPLAQKLKEDLGAPVYLENDSALVGLGEAVAGAGKDYSIVAYVTVSTGVGGVRIVDKKIDKNAYGFEIGHHIINFSDFEHGCDSCNATGHLEAYISGAALERRYGKQASEITDPHKREDFARILATGLNNVVVFWSPDVIILGGALIVGSPIVELDRVLSYLKDLLTIFPEAPPIRKAELGDVGGLHGALAYLAQLPVKPR